MVSEGRIPIQVFINQTGEWETPDVTALLKIVVEAAPRDQLVQVADRALKQAGIELDRHWLWAVASPDESGRQFMTAIPVLIADDGAFKWPGGRIDPITIEELERAHVAGWFDGDPHALCVERPVGGDGVLPGWDDLFGWLVEAAALGGLGVAIAKLRRVLRRHFRRWSERGAKSPYAFLDVVLVRDGWVLGELAQLLQLDEKEAEDLLDSLGYVLDETSGNFELSPDPKAGRLRRRLLRDFLGQDLPDQNEPETPSGDEGQT